MSTPLKKLKIALVTDWLTNLGGAEKVVQVISDIFPEAPIYTTVVNKNNIGTLANRNIQTSFLQYIPVLNKKHQFLLPLLPKAIESLDLKAFDLVISFSSAVAKSVITTPQQIHICYIHTPIRYVWEPAFDDRFKRFPRFTKPAINLLLDKIKKWDYQTRNRPNLYIANSTTTQARVRQYYGLETKVLYPPTEVNDFTLASQNRNRNTAPEKDYYIGIGRLVTYKKFDLLVETFKRLPQRKLILIGSGPEERALKKQAQGCSNIVFMGQLRFGRLKYCLSKAKALLLPQKEDAGIVQLEAFASGVPVIGYRAGGLTDVLQEYVNGLFFEKQTSACLIKTIENFEIMKWNPKKIRETALPYDTKNFQKHFLGIVEGVLGDSGKL